MTDTKRPEDAGKLREAVSAGYARIATSGGGCGGCCGGPRTRPQDISLELGYDANQLASVPAGADLGLGCGNPTALGELKPGEIVLDLGSGAGLDALLAARQVGPTGRVIGVDMTEAMLDRARDNAVRGGFENVEFRRGLIEELPVDDASIDAIVSNCVINLSPEKDRVFREAYRVLRPGGRMLVSDIVLEEALPPEIAERVDVTIGCVGNASLRADYLRTVREAGFGEIEIVAEKTYGADLLAGTAFADDIARDHGLSLDELAEHLGKVTSLSLRIRKQV
ncbi:arsenite methyltransferase [bacterium]|nr:arsenite methyltransferase [bacterium]MBU1072793.1 arsenite methyltransferase [bacterium]MBU1676760.1 arsenite methyltransferase [bacterium]